LQFSLLRRHEDPAKPFKAVKPQYTRSLILKKNLAFAAIALVLLLGAAFQSPNSVSSQLNAIQSQLTALQAQNASLAAQVATSTPRKFYLTKTFHAGDQALSAC
jgi:hypothetical protein